MKKASQKETTLDFDKYYWSLKRKFIFDLHK